MNKKIAGLLVIIGAVAAVVIVGLGKSKETKTNVNTAPGTEIVTNGVNQTSSSNAAYINYSSDIIAKTPRRKVLFFHASWCPQCRTLEQDILKGPLPENWTIIKVDYDSNQDLRKKYGVTLQTTFVKVDDEGNATDDKFVAYDNPSLASVENIYLNSKE